MDVRNEDTDVMRSTRNGVMSGVSFPTKKQKTRIEKKGKKETNEELNNNRPSSSSRQKNRWKDAEGGHIK